MEEFNDALNPENTNYCAFPSSNDHETPSYSSNKITALTLLSNLLFVGTEKGVVTQYMAEEQETDCTRFSYTELMARMISDSPIVKIDGCASINLLAILSDQSLTMCDAEQLERVGFNLPSREVITFNLRETEADGVKLSLAFSSKRVQIYSLRDNFAVLAFEILLSYLPTSLCLSANVLGIVASDRYYSLNLTTKLVTELLQFDPTSVKPFMTVVEQDVFLIGGPSSLGVIVDATGTSQRPPIQMSPHVLQVFVWQDYVYTVTDEFFMIHSLHNQTQLQTVLISNATAACFSPGAMHFVFVSTWISAPDTVGSITPKADLVAIGPERWDQFARKLILAGCVSEANRLLVKQNRRMNLVVQQRPVSSKNEQNIFVKRSRRIFGLLGFHHFEQGDFNSAQTYFERATIDIRELLYRYEDLLPKGYAFRTDAFYQLGSADCTEREEDSAANGHVRSVTDLCLLHALTEAGRLSAPAEDVNPDPAVVEQWIVRYNQFLFDFLHKHHRSKFTESVCHFLETALVKLYLKLSKRGIQPTLNELILPTDRLELNQLQSLSGDTNEQPSPAQDLIQLISSLVHIDVDDLMVFSKQMEAHHALALIYQWQGNLAAALDVWQRLAYGELRDEHFPGVPFYVAVLRTLTLPDMNHSDHDSGSLGSNASHVIPPAYTELVWQHLCRALDANNMDLCEQILSGIPVPSVGTELHTASGGVNADLSDNASVAPSADALQSDRMFAPSQLLSPASILGRILPEHPELARNYLRQLVYTHGDCDRNHHNTLGELYVDAIRRILNSAESSDSAQTTQKQLRREFCHFLRYAEHYSIDRLLNCVGQLGSERLPFETAILLGKSGQHRAALNILLTEQRDMSAALCYCLSFSKPTSMKLDSGVSAPISKDKAVHPDWLAFVGDEDAISSETAFTALVELCFESGNVSYEQLAFELINLCDIPLDYVRVLRALPFNAPLDRVQPFLRRAFRSILHQQSTSQLALGLIKRQAILAAEAVQESQTAPPMFLRTAEEQCASCNEQITRYGPTSAFVWSIRTDRCFHVHCWHQSHGVVL